MNPLKLEKSLYSPQYSRFLHLLINARREACLTQVDAAHLLGKPQSFISKCESGERRVDVVEFIAFCNIYDVDPDDILQHLGNKPQKRPGQR